MGVHPLTLLTYAYLLRDERLGLDGALAHVKFVSED